MHEPISFRNGIDGTAAIARAVLEKEPMDGAIFVLRNRRRQKHRPSLRCLARRLGDRRLE
jgi:transposase